MRLLLSNDDGFDAEGLQALAAGLENDATLSIVAPANEQSAKSHALTMHRPLRVRQAAPDRWAVAGTPADCVYLALHGLLSHTPDLVISGINRGSNLGSDVHYSGTVAAAREAVLQGAPAIAVSLAEVDNGRGPHWETAVHVTRRVLGHLADAPLKGRAVLNINVPNRPVSELRGIRGCHLGDRIYDPMVDQRMDPRGKPYVWIGGPHNRFGGGAMADGPALKEGWATITPLEIDLTDHELLASIRRWTD